MMYLILFETDPSLPKDPEKEKKINEMTKKDFDSGEIKMAGMSPDGLNGFMVTTLDEKAIFTRAMMFLPVTKFKVMPMLSMDEFMDVMKEMQP